METKNTLTVSGVKRQSLGKKRSSRKSLLRVLLFLSLFSLTFSPVSFIKTKLQPTTFFIREETSLTQYIRKIKYSKIQKILRLKQYALAQTMKIEIYETNDGKRVSKV